MPLRSILVATDLSESSETALRAAIQLGGRTGAAVHVLHAIPPQVPSFWEGCDDNGRDCAAIEAAESELASMVAAHAPPGFETASQTVVVERPFHAICMRAREVGAELLILGPPGGHRVGREVMSGTVDRVIRIVDAPCLVAQGPLPERIRRIRVPFDFSDPARETLQLTLEWVGRGILGSSDDPPVVEVCHVMPPPGAVWDDGGAGVEKRLREEVAGAGGAEGATVDVTLPRGVSPAKAILESDGYDLIVMASHGHNVFERWLVGSVASSVTRRAAKPVMLVPPARWR